LPERVPRISYIGVDLAEKDLELVQCRQKWGVDSPPGLALHRHPDQLYDLTGVGLVQNLLKSPGPNLVRRRLICHAPLGWEQKLGPERPGDPDEERVECPDGYPVKATKKS
jgi:hypothetical protein